MKRWLEDLSLRRVMTFLLVAGLLCGAAPVLTMGCGPKTKPVLVKFDAAALTAVQTIAVVEKELAAMGKLTPAQSLDIRLKLRPVIDLGEKATAALLIWEPGQATPASLLQLSGRLTELLTGVLALLPDSDAKAKILSAIAVAQSAWSTVIVVMSGGQMPELTVDLVGDAAFAVGGAR